MRKLVLTISVVFAVGGAASGQQSFQPPGDINFRKGTIYSEGTRMGTELFSLKSNDGEKLPTILMTHGWGGTARVLRRDALAFADPDIWR